MGELTTATSWYALREPAIEGSGASKQTRAASQGVRPLSSATAAERDAILVSLHEERRRLTQAKRLGQASPFDEDYLADLKKYIDEWEAQERVDAKQSDDIWSRLEAVASKLIDAQAEIARHEK